MLLNVFDGRIVLNRYNTSLKMPLMSRESGRRKSIHKFYIASSYYMVLQQTKNSTLPGNFWHGFEKFFDPRM